MVNRVTKAERERIYSRAAELVEYSPTLTDNTCTLMLETSISKQRARHAIARAIRRKRYRDTHAQKGSLQ